MRILVLLIHVCMVELILVHDVLNKYGCGRTKLCIFPGVCIGADYGRVLKILPEDLIIKFCLQGMIVRPFNLTADGKKVAFYHVVLWSDREATELSMKNNPFPIKCANDSHQDSVEGIRFSSSTNLTFCIANVDSFYLNDGKQLELSDGQETFSGNVKVIEKVDELTNACPVGLASYDNKCDDGGFTCSSEDSLMYVDTPVDTHIEYKCSDGSELQLQSNGIWNSANVKCEGKKWKEDGATTNTMDGPFNVRCASRIAARTTPNGDIIDYTGVPPVDATTVSQENILARYLTFGGVAGLIIVAVALVIVIFICRHRRRQKPLPPPKKEEELEEVSCRGPLTTPKGGDDKPKDPPAKEASKAEEKKGVDMNEILMQMQKDLNELREEKKVEEKRREKDRLREANDTAAFINIAASDRDEAEMMLSEGCYKAEFGVENLTEKDVITVFHKLDTKKYKHYTIIPASLDIEPKAIEMFTIKFDGQSKDRVKEWQFKVKKKRGVISALKKKLDMSLELKWPEEHTNNSQPSDLPDEINVSMEDKETSCKGGSNKSRASRSSMKDGASVKEEKTQAD